MVHKACWPIMRLSLLRMVALFIGIIETKWTGPVNRRDLMRRKITRKCDQLDKLEWQYGSTNVEWPTVSNARAGAIFVRLVQFVIQSVSRWEIQCAHNVRVLCICIDSVLIVRTEAAATKPAQLPIPLLFVRLKKASQQPAVDDSIESHEEKSSGLKWVCCQQAVRFNSMEQEHATAWTFRRIGKPYALFSALPPLSLSVRVRVAVD